MGSAERTLRLSAETVRVGSLEASTRRSMWDLFHRYYDEVSEELFHRDLGAKPDVILLRDSGDGSLQGFSTLKVFDRKAGGRRFVAVYSGDTIIDEAYWGQTVLQREFLRYIMRQKLRRPFAVVYWFLISKGYKTYLLLSRNFPEYWPRHDRETPQWQAQIIDHLARELYPDAWQPDLGVLQFDASLGRLRDGVAPVESDMLDAPDIRFFAQKNRGHAKGDELCCIGRINLRLWCSYMSKVARRALGGGPRAAALPARRP